MMFCELQGIIFFISGYNKMNPSEVNIVKKL